ncbi:hypothetical protein IRJ41_011755 [Triplophysa rosa]|uniref:Uncharacterized protein n=1 Tax=Triplophysa rosa TaxID=992332 RepID=A0A9W7W7G5_TRIRA|nr:hypothetical protein IRJ41_011755 [Triplophysa rosa]
MADTCPLCDREYSQLSQHLKLTHKVHNLEERRLLLALESGRVKVREGRCPVPGCLKLSKRVDRHLQGHSELSAKARRMAFAACKRQKIFAQLAALRASDPVVGMVSTLDLQEEEETGSEAEEEDCGSEGCRSQKAQLKAKVADLNKQVDTLASALREAVRQCKVLTRRQGVKPSQEVAAVTRKILMGLEGEQEAPATRPTVASLPPATPCPCSSEQSSSETPHFPDHVAALTQFMDYVGETPPPTCRLSKQALLRIRWELRVLLKSLKRKVTMHQIEVKQAKEGRLIPKEVLRRCRVEAKQSIPRILKTQFLLYGYLMAYFACIYGYRCGVFQNLTIQEGKKLRADSPCFSLTPGSTSSEENETVPFQESGVSALESDESLAEFPSTMDQASPASSCPGPTSPESDSPAEAASPESASSESASLPRNGRPGCTGAVICRAGRPGTGGTGAIIPRASSQYEGRLLQAIQVEVAKSSQAEAGLLQSSQAEAVCLDLRIKKAESGGGPDTVKNE